MQMIYKKNFSVIDQATTLHEKMKKDFYNDYRKRITALINFYYSQNELEMGNKYLFSDVHVKRDYRPRQNGFHLSAVALHESITGKYNDAILTLERSANVFSHLPSYLRIIEHNLSLLKTERFDVQKIEFSFGKNMHEGTFYIDPRCIW
jgi:hypothetical protein